MLHSSTSHSRSSSDNRSDALSTRSTSISSTSQPNHSSQDHYPLPHPQKPDRVPYSAPLQYEILTAREITIPPRPREGSDQLSPGITGFSFDNFGAEPIAMSTIPSPSMPSPSMPSPMMPSPIVAMQSPDFFVTDAYPFDRSPGPAADLRNVIKQARPQLVPHEERDNRRRSRWYDDQFADKVYPSVGRELIIKDAPVIAELKTNVIVKDEFTLVTDLSRHIAERFGRSEASVCVTVAHSACLMYAGSFDPAYILTISALQDFIQPTLNKRNAALTQHFMADVLGVVPERGILKFNDLKEECLAVGSKTVGAAIDAIDVANGLRRGSTTKNSRKSLQEEKSSRKSLLGDKRKSFLGGRKASNASELARTMSSTSIKAISDPGQPPSIPTLGNRSSRDAASNGRYSISNGNGFGPQSSNETTSPILPSTRSSSFGDQSQGNGGPVSATGIALNGNGNNLSQRPQSNRKSILKPTYSYHEAHGAYLNPGPPPAIPDSPETPRITKRKSLISMFKR